MPGNLFSKVEALMYKAMHAERIAVRREVRKLKLRQKGSGKQKPVSTKELRKRILYLEQRLMDSAEKKAIRKQGLPDLKFKPELPITSKKDDIIDAVRNNKVVIISGETGSGKTTQIPKFCLAAGRGIDGRIGCTQPRRIAAITVAKRIAEELGEKIGATVGYKIRFQEQSDPDTYIKIMTDGILLAETQGDRYLNEYDTIIVDEAHERSLNIDFILGILKNLLTKRKHLKLIITSATIDTKKFSKAFNDAPVIEVSGRMFPVDVRYSPVESSGDARDEQSYVEAAVQAVERLFQESTSGDILIFMPTEQDIRETCEMLEGRKYLDASVLPLFARLSSKDQARIFSRASARKVIVATNIAETSITIPGIRYVIDTGLARIPRYTPRSGTTSLPVEPVSRSSADQRKGRCGRVENGVCIRLYSEKDYISRPHYTLPEILRGNLAEVILRMMALKLGAISEFPFIDNPSAKSIMDGYNTLVELGAIKLRQTAQKGSNRYQLTENGRLMAKIPVDPRMSRMLLQAREEGCVSETAVIASALSIRDPRERPEEKAGEADQIHEAFVDPLSDFSTLLNIWNTYHTIRSKVRSTGRMKKYCREHFLSFRRMREWRDIHTQISSILDEFGFQKGTDVWRKPKGRKKELVRGTDPFDSLYTGIHRSIISGYLSNIAVKKEKNMFRAAKEKEVMIFPGSGLFNRTNQWIVAAEMVETSRLFARTAANIDSAWLEKLGGYLCKYTYLRPRWEKNRGEVVADEQVTLFGLIIEPGRVVSYKKINPAEASDIFIRSALIRGDMKNPPGFVKHNLCLIDEVRNMEDRIRRRDFLISEEEMFCFYRERLDLVSSTRSLSRFLSKKGDDDFLKMDLESLFRESPDEEELSCFPDSVRLGDLDLECSYRFEPGKADDGVTIKVPVPLVPAVPPDQLDRIVPGLFREKLNMLLRGLPKKYRKKLVPISDTTDIIAEGISNEEGSLVSTLGEFVYKRFAVDIPASAWSEDLLPDHLRMRLSITDSMGKEIRSGRDRTILDDTGFNIKGYAPHMEKEYRAAKKKWERTGVIQWDFPDLPACVAIKGNNKNRLVMYPALEQGSKKGKDVNLRIFLNREKAAEAHCNGILSLYKIHFSKDLKFLKKSLTLPERLKMCLICFGGKKSFEEGLYDKILTDLFMKNIRTKNDFYTHAAAVGPDMIKTCQKLISDVTPVLEVFHATRISIEGLKKNSAGRKMDQLLDSLMDQLEKLVPDSFFRIYGTDQLGKLERYIKALAIRAQRASVDYEKDRKKGEGVIPFTEGLARIVKELSPKTSDRKREAVEEFFWMLEEYKVSVFAQELKTAVSVSKKRLGEKMKEIERMV